MISKRIKAIASLIPNAKTIADVGCDHGYLIIEAFNNYNIEKAIAIDNKKMPLDRALDNLKATPYFTQVRFSLSSGLSDLQEDVDAIIISGMGGLLIIELLENHLSKLQNTKLIIQANRNTYDVRKYLSNNNYYITNELIVYEDNIYYEIIVFEYRNIINKYSEEDFLFGPILRMNKGQLFLNKLNNDLRILEAIPYQSKDVSSKISKVKEELNN